MGNALAAAAARHVNVLIVFHNFFNFSLNFSCLFVFDFVCRATTVHSGCASGREGLYDMRASVIVCVCVWVLHTYVGSLAFQTTDTANVLN